MARLNQEDLNRYLAEVRRYPLISREEEHALALRYINDKDTAAGQALITANLRLVVKLARDYGRLHPNLLDLVQEGNLGLAMALRKYDPGRGVKFSSYAAWWIRAYILKHLVDTARLVRVGKTEGERKLFFRLRGEKERLEKLGYVPTTERIAEGLKLPEKVVREMDMRMARGDISIDAPVDSHDPEGKTIVETLVDREPLPDVAVEQAELRDRAHADLTEFGRGLTGRDQVIFYERLLSEEPKTLEEVGKSFGISRERARQVEKELVDRLRRYLLREQPANDRTPVAKPLAA
jgi:RNA polymerase sigma-32 factor